MLTDYHVHLRPDGLEHGAEEAFTAANAERYQEVAAERKPYGDPDALTKRMRAIFQRGSNVSYLFAGSIEHVMRDLAALGSTEVLVGLAMNRKLPADLRQTLMEHPDEDVRHHATEVFHKGKRH